MPMTQAARRTTDRLDSAIAAHRAGLLGEAEAAYRALLAHNSRCADALHLLGLLACDRGEPGAALPWLERAIAVQAGRAAFHNTYGRALAALGQPVRAEAAYRAAWALSPQSAEIANNLACLLRGRGRVAEAIEWFWRAGALAPGVASIAVNLAQALADAGDHAASVMQFQHALLLDPREADAQYGLGRAYLVLGQAGAAEACLRQARALRPAHADTLNNLGVALERLGRGEAAREAFAAAVKCDACHPDALSNLGCLLLHDGLWAEAVAAQEAALAVAPLHPAALWARCFCELPLLYDNEAEIGTRRAAYAAALDRLGAVAARPEGRAALARGLGSMQPFFLPYQGLCDRDLQETFGALVCGLIDADPTVALAGRPVAGERVRVAIVTGFAVEHTVWRLMVKGWLTYLDRARFEVCLVHTGGGRDGQTEVARELADRFYAGGDPRGAILAARPHAILFPEIGMDPACLRLAAERLAPLQCVAWGHPQTTGLKTIDVFLSGAAMEPAGAAAQYSERLVCLPGIGVVPMPATVAPRALGRAAFGLREGSVAYWCGQAVYKYLPRHDGVFAAIAARVPDCQFLFIGFARSAVATARFRKRLEGCFARAGLDPARHIVFAESMDQARFLASAAACDVVLDSLGWSGGKSTLDLLAVGRPIVTLEGALMRGRHTAAILRGMGAEGTIARTAAQYVDIAVGLARKDGLGLCPAPAIGAPAGGGTPDLSSIRALEQFLLTECGGGDGLAGDLGEFADHGGGAVAGTGVAGGAIAAGAAPV